MNARHLFAPPNTSADPDDDDSMDDMIDGDRQLTTDSDAIDGGLNDSDLGSPREAEVDDSLREDSVSSDDAFLSGLPDAH